MLTDASDSAADERASRYASGLARHAKALVLLLLVAWTIFSTMGSLSTNRHCELLDVDCSWRLDIQHKLRLGEYSGRDFFFTYGPLGQLALSLGGALSPSEKLADSTPLLHVPEDLAGTLLLVLCLLLLTEVTASTAFVVVIGFAILDHLTNWRAHAAVLVVVVLSRGAGMPHRKQRDGAAVLAGFLCFAAQLITFESGIFAALACVAMLCSDAAVPFLPASWTSGPHQPPRDTARTLLVLVGTYLSANLAINAIYSLSSDNYRFFDYQYYNALISLSYNYTMGSAWAADFAFSLLLAALLLYSVVALVICFPSLSPHSRRFYLGLGSLAILQLKGAIVRSDYAHILIAMAPLVLLVLLLSADRRSGWRLTTTGAVLSVLLVVFWPSPSAVRSTLNMLPQPASVLEHVRTTFAYRMPVDQMVTADISRELAPDRKLLNFPDQNLIAVVLDRPNVTPVLQPYAAGSSQLQQMYVERAERERKQTEVTYKADADIPDSIDNITRSPILFDYFFRNYVLKTGRVWQDFFVLTPRPAPIEMPARALDIRPGNRDKGSPVELLAPAACALLRLHLVVEYPRTSMLGRPATIRVQVFDGDRTVLTRRIVPLQLGREFSTYLYLRRPASTFPQLFSQQPVLATTQHFDRLLFSDPPGSALDVVPSRVHLNRLECVGSETPPQESAPIRTTAPIGVITAALPVRQVFPVDRAGLSEIQVLMATWGNRNTGPLIFSLQQIIPGAEPRIIASTVVDASSLVNNAMFSFRFPAQPSEGQAYELLIAAPLASPENAVTAFILSGAGGAPRHLRYGATSLDSELDMRLIYDDRSQVSRSAP